MKYSSQQATLYAQRLTNAERNRDGLRVLETKTPRRVRYVRDA